MSDKELNNLDVEVAADNEQGVEQQVKPVGFFAKVGNVFSNVGKTLWRWIKRAFMGGDKELSEKDKFNVENIESPLKQMTKEFFRKKLAVTALVILVCLFLFVFIAPIFVPMDVNHTDSLQANLPPNMSMLSVPKELKNDIKSISGFSSFTVGVSNSHKFYMWGVTYMPLQKIDFTDYPEGFDPNNIYFAAAGKDHIVAVDGNGKVFVWGNNSTGQFGDKIPDGTEGDASSSYILMPEEIKNGLDVTQIKQVAAGSSASAIVMKDGTIYVWGSTRGTSNLQNFVGLTNIREVTFTNAALVGIATDGSLVGATGSFSSVFSSAGDVPKGTTLQRYLTDRQVLDLSGEGYCVVLILDGGELVITGALQNGEDNLPTLEEGEVYESVTTGTRHIVAVTNKGNVYAWGDNFFGQIDLGNTEGVEKVYAGSLQTYIVDGEGRLISCNGLKGYLMGTDSLGRDVFTRIIHGGKMTMTVGAVAVIVSSIIAIIVGCLSGYFGGWVDMLLMRITEIFSSLPFLPFAMMLSLVIRNYDVDETTRIVIIMIMLGLLSWTGLARMIRGQVLAEREKEFVIAAKAMGVKENRIAFKHILPNVISVILVSMTLSFAGCLLTESSLSYLGFGVQQPQPTWGNMLNGAANSVVIQNYWWQWLFPSIFLAVATISINIIGDALRDVLDPKSSLDK